MKRIIFNSDEQAVIRNRDLLAQATTKFVQSGLANALAPRLKTCVDAYARELSLRRSDSGEDPDAYCNSTSDWPHVELYRNFFGPGSPRTLSPMLKIHVSATLPELSAPHCAYIELDFTCLSKATKDRKRAYELATTYHLVGGRDFWIPDNEKRFRFDSPWKFQLSADVASAMTFDMSALLDGRRPSLKRVAPVLANLMSNFRQICLRFANLQAKEKLLSPLARSVRPSLADIAVPYSRDTEIRFLRQHASPLLKAARIWGGGCFSEADRNDDLSSRVWVFLRSLLNQKCGDEEFIRNRSRQLPIDDMPGFLKGSTTLSWINKSSRLILAAQIHVPAAVDANLAEVKLAISFNFTYQKRYRTSLNDFRLKLEKLGATSWFEGSPAIEWKRKMAKVPSRFWGYSTTLPVDLHTVAASESQAVRDLSSALDDFNKASDRLAMLPRVFHN